MAKTRAKAKKKRVVTYPDFDVVCDDCGRHFRTPQGLFGHRKWTGHGPGDQALPAGGRSESGSAGSGGSVSDLRREVEELKLQVEKSKLQRELPGPGAADRFPDIAEQAGLGPLNPDVQSEIQRRALQLAGQAPSQSFDWQSFAGMLSAMKEIMGQKDRGSLDGSLGGLLKDLGYPSLRELLQAGTSPRAPETLEVGGINLSGASLTPELLRSILEYKRQEAQAAVEADGRKQLADALDRGIKAILPEIMAARGAGPGAGGPLAGMAGEGPAELQVLVCPKCQAENPLPDDVSPGMAINCAGENPDGSRCDFIWQIEDRRAARHGPIGREPVRKKVVQPERDTIACPTCNQAIDVTGRPVGDDILCSVCGAEFRLVSVTEPIPPGELSQEEKRRRQWESERFQ